MAVTPYPASALAIVGILASGGFGLGGAYIAARTALTRLRIRATQERSMADLAELRTVLDAAAEALRQEMWAAQAVVAFIGDGPRYPTSLQQLRPGGTDEMRRLAGRCQDAAQNATLAAERIALRLGRDHDVSVKYNGAIKAYIDTLEESMPLFEHPNRWALRPGPREESLEEMFERREKTFRERHREYIAAAQALVGSQLSADRTGSSTR